MPFQQFHQMYDGLPAVSELMTYRQSGRPMGLEQPLLAEPVLTPFQVVLCLSFAASHCLLQERQEGILEDGREPPASEAVVVRR